VHLLVSEQYIDLTNKVKRTVYMS